MDTGTSVGWSTVNVPVCLWTLHPPPPCTTKIKKRFDVECFWEITLIHPLIVDIILELALYIAFQGWEVLCGEPHHVLGGAGSPSCGAPIPVEHPHLWSICKDEGGMLPSHPSWCSACWHRVSHGSSCFLWGDGAGIGANLLTLRRIEHWIYFNGRNLEEGSWLLTMSH